MIMFNVRNNYIVLGILILIVLAGFLIWWFVFRNAPPTSSQRTTTQQSSPSHREAAQLSRGTSSCCWISGSAIDRLSSLPCFFSDDTINDIKTNSQNTPYQGETYYYRDDVISNIQIYGPSATKSICAQAIYYEAITI